MPWFANIELTFSYWTKENSVLNINFNLESLEKLIFCFRSFVLVWSTLQVWVLLIFKELVHEFKNLCKYLCFQVFDVLN